MAIYESTTWCYRTRADRISTSGTLKANKRCGMARSEPNISQCYHWSSMILPPTFPGRVGRPTLQEQGASGSPPIALYPFSEHFRFILGYKNLPFDTVWLAIPDVAPTLKEIGASPNKLPDGSERYTVPTLSDPNTGAIVTDSWVIAEYLDKTYPEKPIFPPGSKGPISALDSALLALGGGFIEICSPAHNRVSG